MHVYAYTYTRFLGISPPGLSPSRGTDLYLDLHKIVWLVFPIERDSCMCFFTWRLVNEREKEDKTNWGEKAIQKLYWKVLLKYKNELSYCALVKGLHINVLESFRHFSVPFWSLLSLSLWLLLAIFLSAFLSLIYIHYLSSILVHVMFRPGKG